MARPKVLTDEEVTATIRRRERNKFGKKLGLTFHPASVDAWKAAAEEAEVSLTDWIESTLDKALGLRR